VPQGRTFDEGLGVVLDKILRGKWDAGSNHAESDKWTDASTLRQLGTTNTTAEGQSDNTQKANGQTDNTHGQTDTTQDSPTTASTVSDSTHRHLVGVVTATDADRTYSLAETLKGSDLKIPLAGRAEGRTRVVDLHAARTWKSSNSKSKATSSRFSGGGMLFGGGMVGIFTVLGIHFIGYAIANSV
jgi:hypothetical protein